MMNSIGQLTQRAVLLSAGGVCGAVGPVFGKLAGLESSLATAIVLYASLFAVGPHWVLHIRKCESGCAFLDLEDTHFVLILGS